MPNDVVIKVESLGKRYRIGSGDAGYKTFRETLVDAAQAPFLKLRDAGRFLKNSLLPAPCSLPPAPGSPLSSPDDTIWALRDVSFEVKRGEVIGIIGRNGAGKSTLLKILSKITEPTEGRVELRGRVGSLLEVGTGFHPELTGHENVYLYGAILGMDRWEITRKFDEIIAFAELEKFVDTPVKRYSSGMYMRLAFAVAAHLEPEILLVDEVLAVGDAAFQKKCLGKMGDVSKEGRTVFFVSHNMAAIESLCQRGIVLNQGNVHYIGAQTEAITHYLTAFAATPESLRDRKDRHGTGEISIVSIEFRDDEDNTLDIVKSGQNVNIYFYYELKPNVKISKVLAGFSFKTQLDIPIFLHHNRLTQFDFGLIDRNGVFICKIKRLPFPASSYKIGFSIMKNFGRDGTYIDSIQDAIHLTVVEGDFYSTGEIPPVSHGVCLIDASWEIKKD